MQDASEQKSMEELPTAPPTPVSGGADVGRTTPTPVTADQAVIVGADGPTQLPVAGAGGCKRRGDTPRTHQPDRTVAVDYALLLDEESADLSALRAEARAPVTQGLFAPRKLAPLIGGLLLYYLDPGSSKLDIGIVLLVVLIYCWLHIVPRLATRALGVRPTHEVPDYEEEILSHFGGSAEDEGGSYASAARCARGASWAASSFLWWFIVFGGCIIMILVYLINYILIKQMDTIGYILLVSLILCWVLVSPKFAMWALGVRPTCQGHKDEEMQIHSGGGAATDGVGSDARATWSAPCVSWALRSVLWWCFVGGGGLIAVIAYMVFYLAIKQLIQPGSVLMNGKFVSAN